MFTRVSELVQLRSLRVSVTYDSGFRGSRR